MPFAPLETPADGDGVPVSGSFTFPVPAGAATTVIRAYKSRLARVAVTTAGSAATTFYDSASTGTGTVLAVIPGTATLGQEFEIDMPAALGIVAVGIAGSAALTVSYS